MDMDLRTAIQSPWLKNEQVLNPYGYVLDQFTLINNHFEPVGSTVSINADSKTEGKYVEEIPEGDYVCCLAKILKGNFDIGFLKDYCDEHNICSEKYMLSNI